MSSAANLTSTRWLLVVASTMAVAGRNNHNVFFCDAFQANNNMNPTSSGRGVIHRSRRGDTFSQLHVHHELIPGGGGVSALPDPQELSTHAHALHGYLQNAFLDSSSSHSLLVSNANAAAAPSTNNPLDVIQNAQEAMESFEETQAALAQDKGWWQAYLNIFKTFIEVIHTTIDEPIHKYTSWQGGTWGFSIAIFTASVRSLLVPLSIQQSKATEFNKALQPYVKTINEKFKNDENRKNQAIGKLYEDSEQNPLSGCLLSLLQLPIILGLYRGVRLLALDGKLDEKFLFIPSLEGPVTAATDYRGLDWLTQGWTQIDGFWTPSLGWETTLAFCIMPCVLVLGQKLTMEVLSPPDLNAGTEDKDEADMTPEEIKAKSSEDSTKLVLKFLPLLIGFFSLQVPAGLTIYWFTSNFFTLAQAVGVRKYYEQNPPQIELPDYWDALDELDEGKTPEERRAAAKAGLTKGPSMDDWIINANFHTLVEREPLRATSSSWQRLIVSSASDDDGGSESTTTASNLVVPTEFQSWVASIDGDLVNGINGNNSVESETPAQPVPQTS